MQSLSVPSGINSVKKLASVPGQNLFFGLAVSFLVLSAGLSAFFPVAVAAGAVFLFAGPHNWVELRYFLSRLPSRFGPLSIFFSGSFSGVCLLGLSYALLTVSAHSQYLAYESALQFFQGWILCFYGWLALLVISKKKAFKKGSLKKALILFSCLLALSIWQPLAFGLALVYLHPLAAICILDREIQRSKPAFLKTYRKIVVLAFLILICMVFRLWPEPNISESSQLNLQITRHAGSFILPWLSTHLLVSLHSFLELTHYAVWLLAIPVFSTLFKNRKYDPLSMPVSRKRPLFQKLFAAVFIASNLTLFLLWTMFINDYSATRDLYFTVAVFHILAEIPFLIWML